MSMVSNRLAGKARIIRDNRIIRAYKSGQPAAMIARREGVSRPTVFNAIRRNKVVFDRHPGRIDADKDQEIRERYSRGDRVCDIVRSLGVSESTVSTRVRRFGLQRRIERYAVNHEFFCDIQTEGQAWALGLLSADGCVYVKDGKKYCVSLALNIDDRDAVDRFVSLVGYTGPIHVSRKKKGRKRMASVSVFSKGMCEDLIRYGVTPRKSLTLKPWNGPAHLMPHYFRGLVDGDGTITSYPRKGGWFSWDVSLCGTLPVVDCFARFVRERTGSVASPFRNIHTRAMWTIRYGGSFMPQKVAGLLYANATCFLRRKKRVADRLMQEAFRIPVNSTVTADQLRSLREEFGGWSAVAEHIGITRSYIDLLRHQFGIFESEKRDFSSLTLERLLALHDRFGQWQIVAAYLDMTPMGLNNLLRRRGAPYKRNPRRRCARNVLCGIGT